MLNFESARGTIIDKKNYLSFKLNTESREIKHHRDVDFITRKLNILLNAFRSENVTSGNDIHFLKYI